MEKRHSLSCPVCKIRHVPTTSQPADGVCAAVCQNCGHFFKYRAVAPYKTSVTFTVNGKSYTAGNEFSAGTSLNSFLRQQRISMATKALCYQGGCGICVVEAKMQLQTGQAKVSASLNSCLCPLFMCDGWEITTTEGLGNTKTGLHPIQQKLADFGGTQCGYCSPGQVMNMYGLMERYSTTLTKQMVEDNYEGHLCRCTGYRPILDAMKSLVPTTTDDIEDITKKLCINTGEPCTGHCSGNCSHSASQPADRRSIRMVFADVQWNKPQSYTELLQMLQQAHGKTVKLLGANTGTGYYRSESVSSFDIAIDISGVPDFYENSYNATTHTYTIGANVTLTDLLGLFTKEAAKVPNQSGFSELKKYLYRVASFPIRNRGTWSGNLMLKNRHKTFPSDVFNIMTVLKASLYIGPTTQVSCNAFLTTDMTGKVLSKATFGAIPANDVIACFKVMPRSQNSLALVNGAFRCTVDPQNGYMVSGQPIISLGGISGTFHRATMTETYLVGKQLSAPATLTGALAVMATEVTPTTDVELPAVAYRKTVACGLLYKYFLHVLGDAAGSRFRSGSSVLHDIRPMSSGIQTYDTKRLEWPLTEPLKKLEANAQVAGETVFTDDVQEHDGQLYAAFVTSTQANATIQTIDSSATLRIPGVVKVLTAADIPSGGTNDMSTGFLLPGQTPVPEVLMASSKVSFYGQPVAIVIAESQLTANMAVFSVHVSYTNIQTPVLTIDQAIAQQSTFPKPMPDIVVGTPEQAIATSPHVTSGSFYIGEQYHFYMETQASNALPIDGGIDILSTTQYTSGLQHGVATVTGLKKSKVNVRTKRLGGGFGGKITRNNYPACACALAAFVMNRPVRMRMSLQTNMQMIGKRFRYKADYQVGHDDNGKLNGIIVTYFADQGCLSIEDPLTGVVAWCDNAYMCPNWHISLVPLKTNRPMGTACRSPSSLPAIYFMEQMMEHVARTLNLDPVAVKRLNFYKPGQVTIPMRNPLTHWNLDTVMNQLMTTAQVQLRKETFTYFNQANRWKKKALAVVPMKWGVAEFWASYSVLVSVYGGDGSVRVHHGGVEMGQGINTKVAQVCAYEFGIPIDMVVVEQRTDSIIDANNMPSGGSVTSEVCCLGVITCCTKIKDRMAPVKARLPNPTWVNVVNECVRTNVIIEENAVQIGKGAPPNDLYNSYGATCAEVELDVLTGEYQINRVDIVYDCGESLNPAVDVGQVEGGFIMGLGYSTTEEVKYDTTTGRLLTRDTWTYHPPTNKDIPIDFRISLLKNAPNPSGVLSSKASAEPPLCMSNSVFFALRKCVEEARKEIGLTAYFDFNPPATVESMQTACMVATSQFVLQ